MHYGKPFCSRKFSLAHVHWSWNNGDHLWKGVQESFQVKWLLKFLSISERKNFILKSDFKKLEASSFNNIKWIGFYRLIKLRFCMGQNAGYFNKAYQRYYFFYIFSFKKVVSKIIKHVMLSYLVQQTPWIWFFLNPSKIRTCARQANSLKIAAFAYYHREKLNLKSLS